MNPEKYWSTTETNRFLYRQLRAWCEANGFVVSPKQSKHLVRVRDHHLQIVYPVVSRSRTILRFGVSPAASFSYIILGEATVYLRRNNDQDQFFNEYYMLAIDPYSAKWLFDSDTMKEVWDEVIVPQLEEEILSVLDPFGPRQFVALCEDRKSGILRYSSNPGIDDAPLYLARGHNRIWQGAVKESIPLLEQALAGYEKHFIRCEQFGEKALRYIQQEHSAAQELLSVVKNGDAGALERHMRELEQVALNKTWGVALSSEGKTIRLKKKELL